MPEGCRTGVMPAPVAGILCMPLPLIVWLLSALLLASEPWAGALPTVPIAQDDVAVPLSDGSQAQVRVYRPAQGSGPYPVVIFSHGLGGSRTGYGFLGQRWAAHGYVVVHPDHPGSDTAAFRGQRLADLPTALRKAVMDPAILAGRPQLITRLIDALPVLEQTLPALAGRLDRARIGVSGHSYGAWTTMCVAGMRVRGVPGAPADWSDPRPRAFAALSPNGPSQLSQPADWSGCTRPVLIMTGSDDRQPAFLTRPGEVRDGTWRRQAFDLMPTGDKLLVWFDGARHCTYSDGAGNVLTGEPRPDPAQVEAVAVATLAWWDAQLRDDAGAQAWLHDPASAATLGPWATITAR
jgi:predicted dienelactone hydrolase